MIASAAPLQLALYLDNCPWLHPRHRAPGYDEYVRYYFRTGAEVYDFLMGRTFHLMNNLTLSRFKSGSCHSAWHLSATADGVAIRLGTLHAYDVRRLPGSGKIRRPLLAYGFE